MTVETPTLAQDGAYALLGALGYLDASRPNLVDAGANSVCGVWRYTGLTRPQLANGAVDPMTGELTVETGRPNTVRYASATFAVGVQAWPADSLPGTVELYARRETPAGAWSTANAPAFRAQSATISVPQLEAELNSGRSVLLASRRFTAAPATLTLTLELGALLSVAHAMGWDGTLNVWALARLPSGASGITLRDVNTDAAGAVLTLDVDTQDITGLRADRVSWLGRARRCPRCARPRVSDDFVRDGETRTYVCADCYDIRQVPRRIGGTERPPINEG